MGGRTRALLLTQLLAPRNSVPSAHRIRSKINRLLPHRGVDKYYGWRVVDFLPSHHTGIPQVTAERGRKGKEKAKQ